MNTTVRLNTCFGVEILLYFSVITVFLNSALAHPCNARREARDARREARDARLETPDARLETRG